MMISERLRVRWEG